MYVLRIWTVQDIWRRCLGFLHPLTAYRSFPYAPDGAKSMKQTLAPRYQARNPIREKWHDLDKKNTAMKRQDFLPPRSGLSITAQLLRGIQSRYKRHIQGDLRHPGRRWQIHYYSFSTKYNCLKNLLHTLTLCFSGKELPLKIWLFPREFWCVFFFTKSRYW